jgi:hypothetical protein
MGTRSGSDPVVPNDRDLSNVRTKYWPAKVKEKEISEKSSVENCDRPNYHDSRKRQQERDEKSDSMGTSGQHIARQAQRKRLEDERRAGSEPTFGIPKSHHSKKKVPSRTICIDEVRSVSSSRANRMLRLRRSSARCRLGRTRRTAVLYCHRPSPTFLLPRIQHPTSILTHRRAQSPYPAGKCNHRCLVPPIHW